MRNSPLKLLLYLLPLLEIAGFIIVGGWIGVFQTILLIILTTVFGLFILRTQGFITLINMQRSLQNGEHPAIDVFEGAITMFGGFLLILPGFITDICGLLLLLHPVRWLIMRWLVTSDKIVVSSPKSDSYKLRYHIIEGEWRREDKDK